MNNWKMFYIIFYLSKYKWVFGLIFIKYIVLKYYNKFKCIINHDFIMFLKQPLIQSLANGI